MIVYAHNQLIKMGSEYTTAQKILLFIFEILNLALSVFFLILFSYRYHRLQSYSRNEQKTSFLPRMRVIHSVSYIAVSIAILIFSLIVQFYPASEWYSYILIGGGGPCINSIVMILELFVLRSQLIKQRPYTRGHLQFFSFLATVSVIRFVISMVSRDSKTDDIVNLVLTGVLMIISLIQLLYWIVKRQSLPKFINAKIQMGMKENLISEETQKGRSMTRDIMDDFPYLIPFVSVEKGEIKIILQLFIKSAKISREPSSVESKYRSFYQSSLKYSQQDTKTSDFVSSHTYTIEEIKQLYVLCGRFPLQRTINIQNLSLPDLSRELQQFLQELLRNKRCYRTIILKQLHIPEYFVQLYLQIFEQSQNTEQSFDKNIGLKLLDDKNSIYCSVSFFKHLWVVDHYQFYMKVIVFSTKTSLYPIKRYSDFEELHHSLKGVIKNMGRSIQLPPLPKKHLFHWDQNDHIAKRKLALEIYLRLLINDYNLMEIPTIQYRIFNFVGLEGETGVIPFFCTQFYLDMRVTKGEIKKLFMKNDYITYYEFTLFSQEGTEIKQISKRYSEFQQLHAELLRWMHNILISFKILELPGKLFKGSEAVRHEKLTMYLQNLVNIRDIGKVYAVNAFFNCNQSEENSDSSSVEAMKKMMSRNLSNVLPGNFQLPRFQTNFSKEKEEDQNDSQRFSHMIDSLGYDHHY